MTDKRKLRYQKVEHKIQLEFIQRLRKEGYQKITVSQIIQLSHINRSTFYNHYLDKEDLMEHLQNQLINQITKNLPEINADNINDMTFLKKRTKLIIQRVYQNRDIFKLYLSNKSDGLLIKRFSETAENLVVQANLFSNIQMPIIYALSLVENVMINLLKTWVERDCEEKPQEFSKIVAKVIPDLLKSIIN